MFLELSDLFNKFPLWAGTSTLPNIREKRAFDLYKMPCSDFFFCSHGRDLHQNLSQDENQNAHQLTKP